MKINGQKSHQLKMAHWVLALCEFWLMRIFPSPKSRIRRGPSVDGKALDYRYYTQMRVEGICFRMQSEIQQMVKLQIQILYANAGTKKTKHLPIECLQGTIIIYSVSLICNDRFLDWIYKSGHLVHLPHVPLLVVYFVLPEFKRNVHM